MTAPQDVPGPRPSGAVAPSWHLDPAGRHQVRYWDGHRWTEHVGDGGRSAVDPLPVLAPGAARTGGRPQQQPEPRPSGRTVLLVVLAGLAAYIAFIVVAYLVLRGMGGDDSPPRWLMWVGVAVAGIAASAVLRHRRTPPPDRS